MSSRARGGQIEALTQQIGREMFEHMRAAAPRPYQPLAWEERLMNAVMGEEWFKVQAFRFVDALPTLKGTRAVAEHLKEYFGRAAPAAGNRGDLRELEPGGIERWLPRLCAFLNFPRTDSWRARLMARFARAAARRMAGRFLAGSTLAEAERSIRGLRQNKLAFTIDVLGEAALSPREAQNYQKIYLDLLERLPRAAENWRRVPLIDDADGRPLPTVNVSVKITSIYPGFDPLAHDKALRRAKEELRPLLRLAMKHGAHLHVDMEHHDIKDLTLELCRQVFMEDEFRDYPHFGIVLQAYLRECERDAAEMIAWSRQRGTAIWVRLVKGAYWDTEVVLAKQRHWPCPVWRQKWESDACYERITRMLLEDHRHIRTAFASHNTRSLSHAMAWKQALGVPEDAFELQMLFGMADPLKHAAVRMGQRCRVYTPYGEMLPGMAYLIRRLLENTANESFLRMSADVEDADELLRDPAAAGRSARPFEEPPPVRFEFEEPILDPFENTADTDFAQEANRAALESALRKVRASFDGECPAVIGAAHEMTTNWAPTVNPCRPAEVVARVAQVDEPLLNRGVAAAAEAFASWRRVEPTDRAAVLFAAAEILERRRFECAAWCIVETAKTWREADGEVSQAVDFLNFYGREMVRLTEHARRRDVPGEQNEYSYIPRGATAVFSSATAPLASIANMAGAAIVTGNTVVLRPWPSAAACAANLVEVFDEAGLPPGVLNFVPCDDIVANRLVKHAGIANVAYSGSRTGGLRIHRLAAEALASHSYQSMHAMRAGGEKRMSMDAGAVLAGARLQGNGEPLGGTTRAAPTSSEAPRAPLSENDSAVVFPGMKRIIVEMGGKNAIIIDNDADLDEAIKGVLASAFGCAGQKPTSASRVIVLGDIHDRFVRRLVDAAQALTIGPADSPDSSVAALTDRFVHEAFQKLVEIGRAEAQCALDVSAAALAHETGGYFAGPVIFDDVPHAARIAHEDTAGPLLAILRVADMAEAIELFNAGDYALCGGIFSRSPANIALARTECECGNFFINRRITGAAVDLQPSGGYKLSGASHRAGGPDYLIQFCEARTVTETTVRRGFAPSDDALQVQH